MYRVYVIAIVVLLGIAGCSFAPSGGDKPVINNFTAEPPAVARGGGTTLSWRVTNATGVDIDQGIGVVARSLGSTVIYPGTSTSYRLTATNASGSNTAMVTVSVGGSALAGAVPSSQPVSSGLHPPLVYNFWAEPSTFIRGESTKLSWNVLGANSIRIDPSVGVVKTTGSVNVTPSSSTTYTLTATNTGGSVWATEEVHVLPLTPIVPAINWFAASPSTILEGNKSTISWRTTNAQRVTISGIGAVAASGKRTVAPRITTQYIMDATTATGRFQDAVTVVVQSMNSTVYYQTYNVQPGYIPPLIPVSPDYGPGGGGYSGANGDTPSGGGGAENWPPPPDEEY
jgi:hypothetical protein